MSNEQFVWQESFNIGVESTLEKLDSLLVHPLIVIPAFLLGNQFPHDSKKLSVFPVDGFLGVCAGWLIGHTLTEDRAIVGTAPSKWVGLLPEEEQSAMRKVIIELLHDMSQTDQR